MRTDEIEIGHTYAVKVSGRVQPVRITERSDTPTRRHYNRACGTERITRAATRFYGVNTNTGRAIGPFTAAKCRKEVQQQQQQQQTDSRTPEQIAAEWTQTDHAEYDSNGQG